MESTKADIRTIVASPLVEVDGAATKVNTGSTTALHIDAHMGYAHFLTFWRFYFPQTGSRFVLRKVKIDHITIPVCQECSFRICALHREFTTRVFSSVVIDLLTTP